MQNVRISFLGLVAVAVLSVTLTQCGGTGAVANTPATPAANAGGQYAIQSATDSLYGTSSTCLNATCPTLAQSGTAVTGSVGIAFPGSVSVLFGPFTWTLAGGNSAFSGTMPGAVTSGGSTTNCTFNVNGNFNENAANAASDFNVSYSGTSACATQSGTFVLEQQCTTANGSSSTASARRRSRPDHVTTPC
jgi:hypothetical protein